MGTLYRILLGAGLFVAVVFGLLVLMTAKGDAMSGGGGGVRTTFKGKASFDDIVARWLFVLASALIVIVIAIDTVGRHLEH